MWLLAIKSMLADRGKLLTSLLGVTFAVLLINMQGGLFFGLLKKASVLIDCAEADVWVGHRYMGNVDFGTDIPERWVNRLRGIEGVQWAEPYVVTFGLMKMPDGRFEQVHVVGCPAGTLLGGPAAMVEGGPGAIRQPDGIVVDVFDAGRLGDCKPGDVRELNGRRARVAGITRGMNAFTTHPYVFTTLDRARRQYTTGIAPDNCSYFLVKAKPGVDVAELCRRIKQRVPELNAYDKHTFALMSMEHWLLRTGIGVSFGVSVLLGLLVGLAVVAQTLYAAVTERAREFGTLKAMGADDRCVGRFVISQALANALFGSALGLGIAFVIGRSITNPQAPVLLSWPVMAGSVALIVLVCLAAAWLPYWRIRKIDPAGVMRG